MLLSCQEGARASCHATCHPALTSGDAAGTATYMVSGSLTLTLTLTLTLARSPNHLLSLSLHLSLSYFGGAFVDAAQNGVSP